MVALIALIATATYALALAALVGALRTACREPEFGDSPLARLTPTGSTQTNAASAISLARTRLRQSMMIWGVSLLLHSIALIAAISVADGFNVCLANALSAALWLVGGLLWLSALRQPLAPLGLIILPLGALGSLLLAFCDGRSAMVYAPDVAIHILFAALGWAFLALATLQAAVVLMQHRALHNHPPKPWLRLLPPLFTMEIWQFRTLLIGWLLLSASLVSGFIFLEDLFAQHLVHKTVLSIGAWALFGVVLIGRWRGGWRGQRVAVLIMAAFILLVLAYFGSKFVLELVLGRA
ncbi:MAG: inner membrane protein YpjD [Thioalkalivibrionaceae bacterium]